MLVREKELSSAGSKVSDSLFWISMSKEKIRSLSKPSNYCRDNIIRNIRWELIGINNQVHLFWVELAVKRGFLRGCRLKNIHLWMLLVSLASYIVLGEEYPVKFAFSEVTVCYYSVTVKREWPEDINFKNYFWKCSCLPPLTSPVLSFLSLSLSPPPIVTVYLNKFSASDCYICP